MNQGKSKLKTVIVMVILLLVGVLGVLGVRSATNFMAGASADYAPNTDASGKPLVTVANSADGKGVGVSWSSKKACMAYIEYGSSPATILVKTEEEKTATTSHNVKITSLTGNKKNYYFRIRCGEDTAKKAEWEVFDNGGIPFSFNYEGKPGGADTNPTAAPTKPAGAVPTVGSSAGNCKAGIDYNKDGKVNTLDLISCRNGLGSSASNTSGNNPTPTKAAGSSGGKTCNSGVDYDGNGVVNTLDIIKCRQ